MGPIREVLERIEKDIGHPRISQFSSVEGRALGPEDRLDVGYWTKQARQAVRFAPAARALLAEGNCHCIVDIGPQNVVSHLIKDSASHLGSAASIVSLCDRPKTNTLNPLMQCLSTLFRLGVTPDFDALFAGRRRKPSKVTIPTYPWQRQRYYPSLRPSRTTLAPSASSAFTANQSSIQTWNVGKELYPLLSKEHTMDGVAIIPAAALAMFVSVEARKIRGVATSVDMRILKPVLLEKPDQDVLKLEIKKEYFSCTHLLAGKDNGVVCSGTLCDPPNSPPGTPSPGREKVQTILDNEEIYDKFEDNLVRFGPSFRSIQRVEFASDHAEGWIVVSCGSEEKTGLLRKMDCILHMFGAVAPESPPDLKSTGSFLPSAVNGLVLLADTLPKRLLCCYSLPITIAPNGKRMSASFEVRSEGGELLAYCTDYVVSWVPSSKPLGKAPPTSSLPTTSLPSAESVSNASVGRSITTSLKNILGMSSADVSALGESI